MSKIIFVSGPCGTGKSTFADAYAKHLVNKEHKTIYVIHGDDFHEGFIEPEETGDLFVNGEAANEIKWNDILKFNWDCILYTAGKALQNGIDVIIDYVIENELPKVKNLAESHGAELYYIVLTATEDELERRICSRGDIDLIERAKFLKKELDSMPQNISHIYDNTLKSVQQSINEIEIEKYLVK